MHPSCEAEMFCIHPLTDTGKGMASETLAAPLVSPLPNTLAIRHICINLAVPSKSPERAVACRLNHMEAMASTFIDGLLEPSASGKISLPIRFETSTELDLS
jgi:hypothetical protein